ncbi:MAG: NAD(P)-binding domain-containing protein [Clostridia bacterium]|nr:NAD(P)-binding domain-containing protein [Clostridia bacterium]
MKNICIIGSGSWGVALGIHLAGIGHNIKIWSFTEEEKNMINLEHKCKFLPNATIPENVYCTNSIEEAIDESEIILHVTPSKFTRETVKKYKQYVKNQIIVICSKGFEKETLKTLDETVEEELPNSKIAVLSGPSHAEEVSLEIPTALVVASKDKEIRDLIQEEFMSEHLRIYTCEDVKGVELGRSTKKHNSILRRSCKSE